MAAHKSHCEYVPVENKNPSGSASSCNKKDLPPALLVAIHTPARIARFFSQALMFTGVGPTEGILRCSEFEFKMSDLS